MPGSSPFLADVNVYLDGTKLAGAARAALSAVHVFQTRNGASAFELVVADPRLDWADDPTFTDCKEVKIELGPPGKLKKVFEGDVTAWRHELERKGPTVLVVRGLDRSHRLMRAHRTRTYTSATPLDCARKIAQEAGLTAKCAGGQPAPVQSFRMQANESDFSFLRKLADLEGYLFYIDGSDLHFERPTLSPTPDLELTYGADLETFLPVANFRKPAAQVETTGWDATGKAALVANAGPGDELWSVPGGDPGAQLARFQNTKPKVSLVHPEIRAQNQADTLARAALTLRNLEFLTAEVEVRGNPAVRPGAIVNVKKVGVYSGKYLVTEANHFWDAAGYTTIFYVARDKWGDSSNPQQQQAKPAKTSAAQAQKTQLFAADFVDEDTGQPIANVQVEVTLADGSKQVVATNQKGAAEIPGAPPGTQSITSPFTKGTLARTLAFVAKGAAAGGGAASGGAASGSAASGGAAPGSAAPRGAASGSANAGGAGPYVVAQVSEHKVKTGETLASIAADAGLSESDLVAFNWGPNADVDERLREEVGCTRKGKDGHYRFDDSDDPGIIFVPKRWSESGLPGNQRHTFRVRRVRRHMPDLKLLYEIDVHAAEAKNDTLVLEADDGSWRHEIAVSGLSEVEPGWVELVFPSPPAGARFTLTQDPGDGHPPLTVFAGATFGEVREALIEDDDEDHADA